MAWNVVTAPVPSTAEGPWSWHLHGAARVSNDADAHLWGHADLHYPPIFFASHLGAREYVERTLLVAVPDGVTDPTAEDVVGYGWVELPLADNTHLGYGSVVVHPSHRRHGAGTALADQVEKVIADAGRGTVIVWSDHAGEPPAGAPALHPPTGSGRIGPQEPGALFVAGRGYTLEQAERYSMLRLPLDAETVSRLREEAATAAGDDYRTVTWTGPAPDRWVDQVAVLRTRMSTDVPSAALDVEEEPWDAARVRNAEAESAATGLDLLTVAVEHVPSGALAGYTYVQYPTRPDVFVLQGDTLVLSEHRGRRLGMLLKATLVERLRDERPGAARVHTWNAEENSHMLDINVALGFRPMGVIGMWQRRTT
ncbi:GNAT family N-acetyltransferase [Cellulomonas bogoriensis]|uniref:GCN5 family acetyltransferase n=1 Tax=Cellulomonas bogoriensis 69B4 = DSM 16987 TaxID=1386082 RepID=A0A0A0BRF6_9CELL|nr:GNAT family N-acetyltransferase [Cellulomonas bogoriensis]KGM10540.1 GCN5 family acetyltransferase [Cellulomonas bogoriensis 69B4 = DSM 16987]